MPCGSLEIVLEFVLSRLKSRWKDEKRYGEHVRAIMRAIHTDVVRTDRTFNFYAATGSDDSNVNLHSLYNILVTYCLSHPSIPYCQGWCPL